jgi:hypothetical protein
MPHVCGAKRRPIGPSSKQATTVVPPVLEEHININNVLGSDDEPAGHSTGGADVGATPDVSPMPNTR